MTGVRADGPLDGDELDTLFHAAGPVDLTAV